MKKQCYCGLVVYMSCIVSKGNFWLLHFTVMINFYRSQLRWCVYVCVCTMTSLQTPDMLFTCLTDFLFFKIKIFESVLLLPLYPPPLTPLKKRLYFSHLGELDKSSTVKTTAKGLKKPEYTIYSFSKHPLQ